MSKYNGWTNYETWKLAIEFVNDMDTAEMFDMLGFEHGSEKPEAYDVKERLKDHVEQIFVDECGGDDFIKDWAMVALGSVNYWELAEHLLADIDECDYFAKDEEESDQD